MFGREKTDQDGPNRNSADYFWGWGTQGGGIPKFAGTLTTITDITSAFLQSLIAKVGMVLQLSRSSRPLHLIVWYSRWHSKLYFGRYWQFSKINKQNKLRGLSPHANYTDIAAAAGRRS